MGVDIKSQEKQILEKSEISYDKLVFFEKNGLTLKPEYLRAHVIVNYFSKKERKNNLKALQYLNKKGILSKMNAENLSLSDLALLKEKEYKEYLEVLGPHNNRLDILIRTIIENKTLKDKEKYDYIDYIFEVKPTLELYNYIEKAVTKNVTRKFSGDFFMEENDKILLQKILDKHKYLKDMDKFNI